MKIYKNYFLKSVCFLVILQSDIVCAQSDTDVSSMRIENHKIVSGSHNSTPKEDENIKSLSDKIKVLRTAGEDLDVFFEKSGGPYSIPNQQEGDDNLRNILKKAYGSGDAVQVTIDSDKEIVLHAHIEIARTPASEKESEDIKLFKESLEKLKNQPTKP